MAMVSEVLRLSMNERQLLAQDSASLRATRRRGHQCRRRKQRARRSDMPGMAQDSGATAVMAIPPVSVALMESELFGYYRRIIRRSQSRRSCRTRAATWAGRCRSRFRRIAGRVRAGSRDVQARSTPIGPASANFATQPAGRAKVFEGTGGIALVDNFKRGIVGTMPGADLIRGIVALWRDLQAERSKSASMRCRARSARSSSMQNSLRCIPCHRKTSR